MVTKLQTQNFIGDLRQKILRQNLVYPKPKNRFDEKVFSRKEKLRIIVEGQSNQLSIEEICFRENIDTQVFSKWTNEFLSGEYDQNTDSGTDHDVLFTNERKYQIVIEGQTGISSIAKICNREGISHETFLGWCKEFTELRKSQIENVRNNRYLWTRNKDLTVSKLGSTEIFDYLSLYLNFYDDKLTIISDVEELSNYNEQSRNQIIGSKKVNDIRFVNKYFECINSKLMDDGIFVGCVETFQARRRKMRVNRIPIISDIYFGVEFIFKRILPKVSFTKRFYFDFTKGSDRLLSKAESLGRLVSCGFDIMDFKSIDGLLYFVVKKKREPEFNESPSYGPIYRMPRLGKHGKIIYVYKFRTMHPYSEYLQDFLVSAYGYSSSGKPANDFRIPKWGRFLRRFWLDELPQLINVVKGDMKLVGIRPVSKRYFQDIPSEMKKLRLTQKPGCIPPYVALNRDGNVMSVLQAEREYLQEKIRNPYFTDIRYFFKALISIIFFHKRSA
ncbi:sugar transferase [Lutimonas saemankumensis]|uniref:sugar transferase n=1 Tax=Lutimonas saemankumensis TaxID=483016 RepID=UPI001CD31F98|nr:sugar transferase [Lutimonas saemankumensis]MCA0931076.1 sugar transferase [Lutimonas saemankumensis]